MLVDSNRAIWADIHWKRLLIPPAIAIMLSFLLTRPGGRGEFCPQTLEMRTFKVRVISLTPIEIHRSEENVYTPEICRFLVEQGYWTKSEDTKHWLHAFFWTDLTCRSRDSWYRDIVCHEDEWISWTKENPEWAKVFWSQMLRALREPDTSPFHHSELLYAKRHTTTPDAYLDALNSIR